MTDNKQDFPFLQLLELLGDPKRTKEVFLEMKELEKSSNDAWKRLQESERKREAKANEDNLDISRARRALEEETRSLDGLRRQQAAEQNAMTKSFSEREAIALAHDLDLKERETSMTEREGTMRRNQENANLERKRMNDDQVSAAQDVEAKLQEAEDVYQKAKQAQADADDRMAELKRLVG